jgi:hypothetical protein
MTTGLAWSASYLDADMSLLADPPRQKDTMTPSSRVPRRARARATFAWRAVLTAACGVALVSACSAAPSPPAAPSNAASAAPDGPGASGPVTPLPTTSPAAAGTVPCPTHSLGLRAGASQGTAGSTYRVLDFTNISKATCTLYGYPGVLFASAPSPSGQIGAAAKESQATPRQLVTLAPGGVAHAQLQIVQAGNFARANCQPTTARWLVIFPPDQPTPIYLRYSSPTCQKPVQILTIGVVKPGSR